MSRELGRKALALLLSLLIHTLLLSLTLGGQGLGLAGFGVPGRDRRIEVPEPRVVLVPTHVTAAAPVINSVAQPSQLASIEQPVVRGPAPTPPVAATPPPGGEAMAIVPAAQPTANAKSVRDATAGADPAKAPLRADRPGDAAAPRIPEPAVIEAAPSGVAASVEPAASSEPTTAIETAPSASSPQTVTSASGDAADVAREAARQAAAQLEAQRQETVRQETARQETARVEAARIDAERQNAARLAAARLEAQRQETARREAEREEAARQDAVRAEAARLEAERREASRQAAAQLEAQRQETARREAERDELARQNAARAEAARLEAERREAARQAAAQLEAQRQETARREAERDELARQNAARAEAARLEAERQEAARQAAARQEAARVRAEQEEAARREARLREIGRQLDEEAARRKEVSGTARLPSKLPLSLSTARRVRLWGRTDPNAELIRYAEGWERKIHLNTPVDTVREVANRPHTNPMVTVAVRSDGSVEKVIFVVSSGVAEVDDAIRRIVQSHEHYQAFPPALAREFDVIEIRRTWYFDMAVRLY